MKIPIKFRGRPTSAMYGNLVFGDLKHMTGNRVGIHYDHRIACIEVAPDSVAQLVGYDVDGKEVYEGDTLTDILGNEYTARIRIELICDDRRSTLRGKVYAGTVDNLKLKEKAA